MFAVVAADHREIIRLVVEEIVGAATAQAADGEAALRRVSELKPALVILDVWLPKLDGLEVARQLKSNAATCTIPIIWVTADVRQQKQALRLGAAGFIEKPFDIDEVADTVQLCLEQVALRETA